MLLSKSVKIKINYSNIEKYVSKGYSFNTFINKNGKLSCKRGTEIEVKIEDLDFNSSALIKFKCDYCGEEVEVRFCDYMRHKQSIYEIDACKSCCNKKTGDSNFKKYGTRSPFGRKEVKEKRDAIVKDKYGVNNVFQLNEVKDKIKETNINKYGKEFYTQTEEYKNRYKETCLEKYGVDNLSRSQEIKDKIKETQFNNYGCYYTQTDECKEKYKKLCQEKYGVDNAFQSEEIKEKSKNTMIKKYGVDCLMKIPDEAIRRVELGMKTKQKYGTLPSSKQQEYLHKIYGGSKNYVVGTCALDVALLDEMIDIEGDFSGHELRVKYGECTYEEFLKKERKRKYFLRSKGWKDLRIISRKDYLPNDYILLEMLDISKQWFNNGHTWIKFDIDNKTIENSEGIRQYNYGKLRKIKDEDLETI